MDPTQPRAQSPSQIPASSSKYHHPYFTPAEVEYLSEKQRGKLSVTQEERVRQNACGFLEALGARVGLCVLSHLSDLILLETHIHVYSPRRTIGTAQNLYHRFHLFFPRKDFHYYVCSFLNTSLELVPHFVSSKDVSLAALYVSTKMHDTLKKPRELLAASYAVRYPDLVAKSKHPGGEIDVDNMDQVVRPFLSRLIPLYD